MKHWYRIVLSSAVVSFVLALGLRSSPIVAAPPAEQSSMVPEPAVYLAGHSNTPFRVPPPASPSRLRTPSATITVNYLAAGATNIYGDSCSTWPADAQTAFTFAVNIWGGLLNSSVPISVNACWASLASGLLGHAGARSVIRNFTGAPMANTWYPVALANALSGTDQNGTTAEIEAGFASSSINWYFGTDGNPGSSQYDFVSVVLHEVGHGLGFLGSMSVSGGQGSWGSLGSPNVYDRFTQNGSGQSLTTSFPNPSAALATQLTSGNVYFSGTNANAANGGTPVKLYAPGTWSPGSSYSHLDTIYDGTVNALMTYSLSSGTPVHDPGPVTLGIFKDLGWNAGATGQTTKLYLPLVLNNYGTTSGWTTIVSEDFEGSFPGSWVLQSSGGYTWGRRTCRPYAGSYSGWGIGGGTSGASSSCGMNYPNNANSWMIYGPFSLVGATKGDLSFKLWLNSELNYDFVCRYASIDGTSFSGTCTSGNTAGWVDKTLDLTNVYTLGNLMGQSNVWVALKFSSDSSNTYAEGGYVDNVVLRKCPTGATCPAATSPVLSTNSQIIEIPAQTTLPR